MDGWSLVIQEEGGGATVAAMKGIFGMLNEKMESNLTGLSSSKCMSLIGHIPLATTLWMIKSSIANF